MSKYEAVYFVGDNQAINRVRIDSSKTRNRGAFSGSLAALLFIEENVAEYYLYPILSTPLDTWYPTFHNSNANTGFARYFSIVCLLFFYPAV